MKKKILKCVFLKEHCIPHLLSLAFSHTHGTLVIISHFSGLFTINLKNSYLLVTSFLSFGYKRL